MGPIRLKSHAKSLGEGLSVRRLLPAALLLLLFLTYPLGLNAHNVATARTVAIGNAAQTLHPVAGQGLNLGLRDAVVLAQLVSQNLSSASIERFTAQRQTDRSLTIRITDTMARIFASTPDGAATQAMLGLSLGLLDAIKPAKRLLAEQMMFGLR